MKKNGADKNKNIFSAEFKHFCRKELSSRLKGLEILRLFYLFGMILGIMVALAIIFLLVYHDFGRQGYMNGETINRSAYLVIIYLLMVNISISNYKKFAKGVIFKKILSFIGVFKINKTKFLKDKIFKLHLFDSFSSCFFGKRYTGKYKLLDVDITEINLKSSEGKRKNVQTVFNGVLITVPNKKRYQNAGYTLVKPHSTINFNNNQRIQIEDEEFNKYYDVYSNDRLEAIYMLNKSFIKRMINLAKKEMVKNISICFEQGNIYIAIAFDEDLFEIPFSQPATKIENYKSVVTKIIILLKIIDSLNLDKQIGL